MVLSIRKISFENEDLAGAGMLWFPNLNEPDPYLILPVAAALLNYFNLSVSKHIYLIFYSVASLKKTNIGTSIVSVPSFRSFSSSICHSRTLGLLELSFTGSALQALCLLNHP